MHQTKILPFALGVSVLCLGGGAFAQTPAPKPAAAAPAAKPAAAPAAKPMAAAPAAAAPATPPAPPTPAAELDAFMKPFEGTWKCETTFPAGAMGPAEVKAKATAKFKKDMGGFFWKIDYALAKAKGVPPLAVQVWIGYDKGGSQFTQTVVDNMGGTTLSTGKPEGDSLTTMGEGYSMGQKVKVRETLWHKDKTGGHKAEIDAGKGWMPLGTDECKK
jgi:hypothetical protein